MSTLDAAAVAQLARRLDLISDDHLADAWEELGSKTGPAEPLLRYLERKGVITPWQGGKLLKGEKDGYFLGGYRVLYRISAGSFGRVYRADNPRTGEVVAIKVLRKRWGEDKKKVESFEREGKVGMTMLHPNIVQILAVSRAADTGQYYIVMEFVEGGNLKDFLGIRKKLDCVEGLRILEEMASGLHHALSVGLTHRDIKPTNILISSSRTAKMVDFGLAEFTGGSKDDGVEMDRTVDYAGLEKATGVKAGDPRSDIYFLGCTFHEMITGRPLLSVTKDAKARMVKERFELGSKISRTDPDIPPPIHALLSRMVAFDPADRFQNYEQLIEAIQQAADELKGGGKTAAARTGPVSVFIVEQNQKLQDAFRDKLKQHGYRVMISINAPQAFARYVQSPYEVLLVDCGTVGESGLEMFERVINQAEIKRQQLHGIVILSEDQAHWAGSVALLDNVTVLVRPVTMRQITDTLAKFAPSGTVASEKDDE